MDVTEIKNQQLGLILDSFYICQNCHLVDTDHERCEVGHLCSTCGKPSTAGRSYFNLSVNSLINLMQEFYHVKYEISEEDGLFKIQDADNAKLAVVIFFTSLREVCMDNFLDEIVYALNLPANIHERLFADSPTCSLKMNKLFPSLVGLSWKKAIDKINKEDQIDYKKVDQLMKKVADARNNFLHQGTKRAISNDLPKDCIKNIWPLLNLFVALHNKFVFPIRNREKEGSL